MRLAVNKTYKQFIGGAFVRSESDRTLEALDGEGKFLANVPHGSRKDVRDSVVAARAAFGGWSGRTAYNRGQILYRVAEMLEARLDEFAELEKREGGEPQVSLAIDRLVYYAGWADKYGQVMGTVNPVAAPYFNFSTLEPTGVVGVFADTGLLALVSQFAPVIVSGNSCVVVCEASPVTALEFGEVLATSDLPGGVVNLITGRRAELSSHLATHMDVNALDWPFGTAPEVLIDHAASNVKRLRSYGPVVWTGEDAQSPYHIERFTETKTVWHPIGV